MVSVAGSNHGDGGVAHGALLTRLAEEIHAGGDLADLRAEVIDAVGEDGYVDAVAVCANFNMMVRIADGTGTPLDEGTAAVSSDLREEIGVNQLLSARIAGV